VKLLDFGIAKTTQQASKGARVLQGKYEYMSPEQVRGEPLDVRSDLFSLGVCLYEVLTSRSLYARDSLPQILSAIVEEPVPSVRAVRPELPEALDRIVRKALMKRPDDRFQSAAEMERALEEWLAKEGQTVSDVRVALAIEGLFSPEEKAPLRPGAADITGTLPALTALAAGETQESWSERFEHRGESPSAGEQEAGTRSGSPSGGPVSARSDQAEPARRVRRKAIALAALALGVVLVAVGAFAAMRWLLP
jgi:serine/threonine-protein kinase